MATVIRFLFALATAALLGCGKPVGLDAPVTPLMEIHVQTTGDLPQLPGLDGGLRTPNLRVALVWGLQWMPEPFCFLPPESDDVRKVIQAGCRDNFGFVPNVVGPDVPIEPGVPTTIPLVTLPAADVMVGDVTGRIAYGSLIVYDDRNDDGTLNLGHPQRQSGQGEDANALDPGDVVLGASFSSMTRPDQRIAYVEGDFSKLSGVAFYPRPGCPDPPARPDGGALGEFWVLSAGGMSEADLFASLLPGLAPKPTEPSCGIARLEETVVTVALQNPGTIALPNPVDASTLDLPDASSSDELDASPASTLDAGEPGGPDLSQLACATNDSGGVTSYRGPVEPRRFRTTGLPNLNDPNLVWACAGFPSLPGDTASPPPGQQLVMAWKSSICRITIHYTLRGCRRDPGCAKPDWDDTGNQQVLAWWPCQLPP